LDSTTSTLPPEAIPSSTLLFRVGDVLYGCDISEPQEIIPLRAATRLPGAPPYVRGLINVRGIIVTVIDLGVRLDASRAPAEDGSILLVRHRDRLVGMVVDEVVDVRALDIDDTHDATSGGVITKGVATIDDAAIVVLDLDALTMQVLLS
jgi:purine-binding chemotaxis protein CheW